MDDTERWHRLKRKLDVLLGPEDAETLMAPDTPPGWPDLTTKDDLAALRTELHADMDALRTELRGDMAELRAELRGEMDALRTELRGEMDALRTELRGEMPELRGEMAELRGEVHSELGKLRVEMAGQVRTHVIVTVTAVAATGSLAFTAASLL
jgi:hypothetical protein